MSNAKEQLWDVAVIGTGMGGGSVGYELAKRGHKVLFIERGGDTHEFLDSSASSRVPFFQYRLAAGWWPTKVAVNLGDKKTEIFAPLGCGVGGSTAHYAGALERFSSEDFFPDGKFDVPSASTAVTAWPIDYQDFCSFYEVAEKLLCVAGEYDPLSLINNGSLQQPQELTDIDKHFLESFTQLGMHPYRQPLSKGRYDGLSDERFIGNKVGSKEAFVMPAIEKHGATLWDNCEVLSFDANQNQVNSVRCQKGGRVFEVKAKRFVLAAGALFSPAILLRSANDYWPQGLANRSGMVGKNLMFHVGNQFAMWPNKKLPNDTQGGKSLSFRDFYIVDKAKLGSVQSLGIQAGRSHIFNALEAMLEEQGGLIRVPKKLLKLIAVIGEKVLGKAEIFTCLLEDFPYEENKIVLDESKPSGIAVMYTVTEELKRRALAVRKNFKATFKSHRILALDRGVRLNYGHPCGTCRSGEDSSVSVVDKYCKAHGVENLYVCDSSFFPSSGGVNPSLTIAANGLRVAEHIDRLEQDRDDLFKTELEITSGNSLPEVRLGSVLPATFEDKVVVITGAGSGLGQALAVRFSQEGATVIGLGRDKSKLQDTESLAAAQKFHYFQVDVCDASLVEAVFEKIVRKFGSLDVVINNAAVYDKALLKIDDMDKWWKSIEINVKACAVCGLAALPYMQRRRYGRIINIGSFADKNPLPGSSAYSVSKGALHTLTKSMAKEINRVAYPDISVNEFIPGPMKTQMGSEFGEDPEINYQSVRKIILAGRGEAHGGVFTKAGEVRPVMGFKQKIKKKIKRVIGMG